MKCFIFQQGASETQINCNQIHLYETTYKPHKQNAKINKTVNRRRQRIQAKYFHCTSPLFICKMAFSSCIYQYEKIKCLWMFQNLHLLRNAVMFNLDIFLIFRDEWQRNRVSSCYQDFWPCFCSLDEIQFTLICFYLNFLPDQFLKRSYLKSFDVSQS